MFNWQRIILLTRLAVLYTCWSGSEIKGSEPDMELPVLEAPLPALPGPTTSYSPVTSAQISPTTIPNWPTTAFPYYTDRFVSPPVAVQSIASVAVGGGTLSLGGYWGLGVPVVPHVRYPSYYQGYFDAGIGATPVVLGNIVTFGGILYIQNADGTLTLFR